MCMSQACPTLKRAHQRAATCHLRLGDFAAAQRCIDALKTVPGSAAEVLASQDERDALQAAVQQVGCPVTAIAFLSQLGPRSSIWHLPS